LYGYILIPSVRCEENNYKLEPPPAVENFNWHKYLIDEQLIPAEREFFTISKEPILTPDIQVGMKLEAVDIRNMSLTCVATVQNIINDRLLIHFDSWDCIYDYWTDTSSPFIHPVGYCKKNGIELTPPKSKLLTCQIASHSSPHLTIVLFLTEISAHYRRSQRSFRMGKLFERDEVGCSSKSIH